MASEEVDIDIICCFQNLVVDFTKDIVKVFELILDSLLVVDGCSGSSLWAFRHTKRDLLAAFSRWLVVHHGPEHVGLLGTHFLFNSSGCSRSSIHNLRLGGECLFLIFFELSWLGTWPSLNFEHAGAGDFTLLRDRSSHVWGSL